MEVDPQLLHLAARLRLSAPRFSRGTRQGERRGRATGQGQEFADHRPYHAGDDLRRVDWSAYERLESILIRLSHEDRDQRVLIVLDATAPMGLSGRADHAATLACGLALAGLLSRDQVQLGIYGGAGERTPRLLTGEDARALPSMLQAVATCQPGGAASGREALLTWARRRRYDRALLLSDLLVEPDEAEGILGALAAAGERAALLHVLSPDELRPDLRGALELEHASTGERLLLQGGAGLEARYQETLDRWQRGLQSACRRRRVQLIPAHTTTSPAELLAGPLRRAGIVTGRQGAGA